MPRVGVALRGVASAQYDAVLDAADEVAGRPFTDPRWTGRDADVLRRMLARQREVARSWLSVPPSGGTLRERDAAGHRHWLAVPDVGALLRASDLTVVGFFGQSRAGVDHTVLFELEEEVAAGFPRYAEAGLLSYYDMELGDGAYGYGNLILFSTPDVPREWYTNEAHERAVVISPQHYHSIRLHKGSLPGPFLGDGDLTIERTKYLDFASDPPWRALRTFS
jgi:hypothetical protein